MAAVQKKETEELIERMANEEVPKIKFSSRVLEKRNYLTNLIKSRHYREAEVVKNTLKEMEVC
jgi:protein-arginine kinase activator protein McsA